MTQVMIHERPGRLRRPVLHLAFAGWNDAAESATNAARFLRSAWNGQRIASLDPEEFCHFGLQRPLVRLVPGTLDREIVWPELEFMLCTHASRDVIVGVGIEPHLRWKTYCRAVLDFARELEIGLVVTLGALLAEVPHTRPVRLTGFATDPELAAVLGVRPTRYEGPTGIVGVLSLTARASGLATASLWANVPHYISAMENPRATLALVQRVNRLLDGPLDFRELEEAATQFDSQLTEVLQQNRKVASYVRRLETKDQETEEPEPPSPGDLPSSKDLVAEIERFLRQQPPGPMPEDLTVNRGLRHWPPGHAVGDVGPPVEGRRTQRRRSSPRRVKRRAFLVGFALLGIASPAAATGGGTPGSARLSVTPPSPELGDVVLVELTGAPPNASVVWDGHALPLFPTEHGMA